MNGNTANTSSNHTYLMVHGEYLKLAVKIRNDVSFQRVIDAYCDKTGIEQESVKFLCDGRLLRGEKSIISLGLEDNDIIETHISKTDNVLPDYVQINIFGLENIMVEMLVKKHVAMENLMLAYSECLNVSKNSIVFKLGSKIIRDEDTAYSIKLKDGDSITVSRKLIKRRLQAEHSKKPPSHLTQMSTMRVPARRMQTIE